MNGTHFGFPKIYTILSLCLSCLCSLWADDKAILELTPQLGIGGEFLAFSPDGNLALARHSSNGCLALLDDACHILRYLEAPDYPALRARFLRGDPYAAGLSLSPGGGRVELVWNLSSGKLAFSRSLAKGEEGVFIGVFGDKILVRQAQDLSLFQGGFGGEPLLNLSQAYSGGQELYALCENGLLVFSGKVYDLYRGECLGEVPSPREIAEPIPACGAGEMIGYRGQDGSWAIASLSDGRLIRLLESDNIQALYLHDGGNSYSVLSGDDSFGQSQNLECLSTEDNEPLFSLSWEGSLSIGLGPAMYAKAGTPEISLDGKNSVFSLFPQARRLALANRLGNPRVLNLASGQITASPGAVGGGAPKMSANADYLGYWGADGASVTLLDLRRGKVRSLSPQGTGFLAFCFSPDSRHMALVARAAPDQAAADDSARLWLYDLAKAAYSQPIRLNGIDNPLSVVFSPNGTKLYVFSEDGLVSACEPGAKEAPRLIYKAGDDLERLQVSLDGAYILAFFRSNRERQRIGSLAIFRAGVDEAPAVLKALGSPRFLEPATPGSTLISLQRMLDDRTVDSVYDYSRLTYLEGQSASLALDTYRARREFLSKLPHSEISDRYEFCDVDGKSRVLSFWEGGRLGLYDGRSADLIQEFRGHLGGILLMARYLGQDRLLTFCYRDSVRLWDIGGGQCLAALYSFPREGLWLCLGPGGSWDAGRLDGADLEDSASGFFFRQSQGLKSLALDPGTAARRRVPGLFFKALSQRGR